MNEVFHEDQSLFQFRTLKPEHVSEYGVNSYYNPVNVKIEPELMQSPSTNYPGVEFSMNQQPTNMMCYATTEQQHLANMNYMSGVKMEPEFMSQQQRFSMNPAGDDMTQYNMFYTGQQPYPSDSYMQVMGIEQANLLHLAPPMGAGVSPMPAIHQENQAPAFQHKAVHYASESQNSIDEDDARLGVENYALPDPVNGCIYDHKLEHLRMAVMSVTPNELDMMEQLETFANLFKSFTQGDVGYALGRRFGSEFSQTTISRFEACNLSFKNMCKLQPVLEEWMAQAERAISHGSTINEIVEYGNGDSNNQHAQQFPVKKRKRRTNLTPHQHCHLEVTFKILHKSDREPKSSNSPSLHYKAHTNSHDCMTPHPTNRHMADLGKTINLPIEVVKVWFCNRRQRMRRNNETLKPVDMNNLSALCPKTTPKRSRRQRTMPKNTTNSDLAEPPSGNFAYEYVELYDYAQPQSDHGSGAP